MLTAGSITSNIRSLNDLYRSFYDASALSAAFAQFSLTSTSEAKPLINYSNFKEHIFFDKATRKLESAFNKILNEYPIGVSGLSVASLTGVDKAAADLFINRATEFEKYVLNYLGGATSDILNYSPSITAPAIVSGVTYPVIVIYRNSNNLLTNAFQTSLSTNLYDIATNFDSGYNEVQRLSLTADHDIEYTSSGNVIESRIIPKSIIERINRSSDLSELLPDAYFYDDKENNLERYLAVMGRTFDSIKTYIDEFPNLNTISYDKYHRVPDGLFQIVLARQYGVDLVLNTLNEQISKYLRSVDNKLPSYKIANIIFNRILNNLIHLLKRKGSKEAIESLIRVFGLPTNYMSLNSYEYYGEEQVRNRVDYLNTRVLNNTTPFGKITFDSSYSGNFSFVGDFTIGARVCLTGNYNQPNSGIIFWFGSTVSGYHLAYNNGRFFFRVNNATISTPSSSATTLANVLTSNFVNVFGIRNGSSGIIHASWIDTTVGTGTYKSIRSATSVNISSICAVLSALSAFICGTTGSGSGFVGYVHEVKGFRVPLSDIDVQEHTKNFESITVTNTLSGTTTSLAFHYKLKENKTIADPNNYVIDSSGRSTTGHYNSSLSATNPYKIIDLMRKETEYSTFGGFVDDNMDFTINDQTKNSKVRNKGVIALSFSPINAVNDDIENVLGNFNLGNLIADPRNFLESASSYKSYPAMEASASMVFSRYNNQKLNFNGYLKAIDNFSPVVEGLINLIDQFIPARTKLISKGVLIEPHILNRPRNKQTVLKFDQEDISVTANANISEQSYEDEYNDMSFRILDNALTSIKDITSATNLASKDSYITTDSYIVLTGDKDIMITSTGYNHTLNSTVVLAQNNIIYPFIQEVANKKDTGILFTTNKNILENNSSLSSDLSRSTITGNIKLLRTSTGKRITSQNKTVRLEFPTQEDYSIISMTANNAVIYDPIVEFTIDSLNGINFSLQSREVNVNRGIQNLRIINLLSGSSQEFPLIIMSTSADAAVIGGGQIIIRIGKAVV